MTTNLNSKKIENYKYSLISILEKLSKKLSSQ